VSLAGRAASRVFLFVPFVCAGVLSLHTIYVALQAGPGLAAARLVEEQELVSSEALAQLPDSYFESSGCYMPARQAAVTLALALADRQNIALDYETWAAAIAKAEGTIVRALSCSPADGNLWLRLAMTRLAAGEDPGEQVALLGMSQQMEPNNAPILTARLSHWRRLSKDTLRQGEAIVGADISLALRYLDAWKLRLLDPAQNDEWKRIVASRIALLPEDKQKALLAK
jgi:hypothetical protein